MQAKKRRHQNATKGLDWMSDKLKTIGVDKDKVWKALKELALEQECTLSEVIEKLLKKQAEHGTGTDEQNRTTDKLGK
jgi:macrodomain Ter protein organizer (MatP/YcbG family)